MALSPRQAVEVFQLQFLRLLTSESDRGHYTLKGGSNLRFFFKSVRFSEDMDLDVAVVARSTLKNKVDRLLGGKGLGALLSASGITVADVTAPKQTETTQRWKMALRVEGLTVPLRTKVELSRRPGSGEARFEAVDRELARAYRLTPPLVSHYIASAALSQKIGALAGRPETQARDVFDLHLLIAHLGGGAGPELRLDKATRAQLPQALERALGVSHDDYRAQVVAFLEPEHQLSLGSRAQWDDMQAGVVDFLEAASRP